MTIHYNRGDVHAQDATRGRTGACEHTGRTDAPQIREPPPWVRKRLSVEWDAVEAADLSNADAALTVARQYVVGQREQRVSLGTRREDGQLFLGSLGEVDRTSRRVLNRPVLTQ